MEPDAPLTGDLATRARATTAARLQVEYAGLLSVGTVQRFVDEVFDDVEQHTRAANWVPLIAERITRERLAATVVLQTPERERLPQVLFVCVQNSGRSQLAAALMQSLAKGRVGVWSAGSDPSEEVEPRVARIAAQVGARNPAHPPFPKPLLDEVVAAADVIVTMGCDDACPVLPGKRYIDWPVADPKTATDTGIQEIRADITARVIRLLHELIPGWTQPSSQTSHSPAG